MTTALRGLVVLSVLCGACTSEPTPVAPSPVPSPPQLGGTYTLTLTPCALPDGDRAPANPAFGPYQSTWTFSQQDGLVIGRYYYGVGPAVSWGTLTARVVTASGQVVVDSLQFSWSSSHVGLLQFSAAGEGAADKAQVAGTVTGEQSWNTSAIGGSRSTCSGSRMPFRFTRVS